jgi:hypothetical protein
MRAARDATSDRRAGADASRQLQEAGRRLPVGALRAARALARTAGRARIEPARGPRAVTPGRIGKFRTGRVLTGEGLTRGVYSRRAQSRWAQRGRAQNGRAQTGRAQNGRAQNGRAQTGRARTERARTGRAPSERVPTGEAWTLKVAATRSAPRDRCDHARLAARTGDAIRTFGRPVSSDGQTSRDSRLISTPGSCTARSEPSFGGCPRSLPRRWLGTCCWPAS